MLGDLMILAYEGKHPTVAHITELHVNFQLQLDGCEV